MGSVRRITDSVRVRVTLLATVLVAVVLTVGALLLTRAVEGRLVNDRQQAAAAAVGATVDQVEAGVPFNSITAEPFGLGGAVAIYNETGAPVGGSRLPVKTVMIQRATESAPGNVVFISGSPTQDVTYDAAPVAVAGGNFYVVGMASLAEVRRSVRTLWSGLRLGIPLVVIAVALVAWFLAGRALRPGRGHAPRGREHLGHHAATARARAAQSRRGRPPGADDELHAVATAVVS